MYNVTHSGNARVVMEGSHQATRDTHAAEHWYKRAFELSTNRELRAKAAFMAAKAELGLIYMNNFDDSAKAVDPIAKTWFPIVKSFANTKYYQEALKECGYFRDWVSARK
jgi:catechol-2,3-dioxygenase